MVTDVKGVREGYRMTEFGEIPEEWRVKTLGDITEITMGQSPASNTYNDLGKGIPFYQGKAEFGRKFPQVKKWCTQPTKIAQENDVLFSVRAPVGEVNMCQEESCIGRGLGSIRAINGKSFNWYLYFLLQYSKTKFSSLGQGSTFTAINGKELREFRIPTPPYKEQQNISEILSTVDETIEKTNQLLEKTKELKKGLMQQLLTKGIGHTTFKKTELGEIPEGWEVMCGENLFEAVSGYAPSKLEYEDNGEYLFVKVSDMNNSNNYKYITHSELRFNPLENKRIKTYPPNTIIFPKRGAAIFTNKMGILNITATFDPNIMGLRCKPILNNEFLYYYLKEYGLFNISDNSGVPQLNNKHIYPLRIPVPPLEEQRKVVSILSAIDEQIQQYQKEEEKYEELKTALMQKLLTGQVRVNV